MSQKGKIYIGSSGFSYDHWANGVFYPKELHRKDWLPYYASQFNAVELNLTFLKIPEKESFVEWREQVPAHFRFSVKGYHYLTHEKRLKGIAEPLRLFMDRVIKLKEKLSCILWEIPPLGIPGKKLLEGFIAQLKKYPHIRQAFDLKESEEHRSKLEEMISANGMALLEYDEDRGKLKSSAFRYFHSKGEKIKSLVQEILNSSNQGLDCFCFFTREHHAQAVEDAKELFRMLEG